MLKRSIMGADRSHIHHYYLSQGFSHLGVTVRICIVALALLTLGIVVTLHFTEYSSLVFLLTGCIYLIVRIGIARHGE